MNVPVCITMPKNSQAFSRYPVRKKIEHRYSKADEKLWSPLCSICFRRTVSIFYLQQPAKLRLYLMGLIRTPLLLPQYYIFCSLQKDLSRQPAKPLQYKVL